MKLRYLLYTVPSLSMAAETPSNFADAFDALFSEQKSATAQAVADTKRVASIMTPEKLKSRYNYLCESRFEEFNHMKSEIAADLAVLYCPYEWLGSAKQLFSDESSERLALSNTFNEEKQAVQDRLNTMEMQGVVLCDGSSLSVRTSVLEEIPYIKALMNFQDEDMVEGKIVLGDDINPKSFRRLVAFLAHRKSGVTTNAPELFESEPEQDNASNDFLTLLRNQELLTTWDYLHIDTLQEEIKKFGQKIILGGTFTCHNLCQLAQIPASIWNTLSHGKQFGKPRRLQVDFSDNSPYLSDAVNASIQAFDTMGVKIEAESNAKYSSAYKDRISLIKNLLLTKVIPDSVKMNILDSLPELCIIQECNYYTRRNKVKEMSLPEHQQCSALKEKIQSHSSISDPLKEKMIAVIDEILTKIPGT